jgi:hypothetical protein
MTAAGSSTVRQLSGLLIFAAIVAGGPPASADPQVWRLQGWETDFTKATVDFTQIVSGGPPRDGIPPIDSPRFEPALEVDAYADREPVIQLVFGEAARAYPLSVLTWHEIVNDTFAGVPVAVTYCPLCNASVVFDRRFDGRILDFGTTGLLRNSDLIMYDRQTESWWQQFTGQGIVGAHAGEQLGFLPSRVVSFGEFRQTYPDGEVLVPADAAFRDYGRNPYVNYDSRSAPYPLYTGDLPAQIDPLERVVVVRRGGDIVAITLAHLRDLGRIEIDGVSLEWTDGMASALDSAAISRGRNVGSVTATDRSGAPLVHDVTFAFVLFAFHPNTTVHTETGALELSASE